MAMRRAGWSARRDAGLALALALGLSAPAAAQPFSTGTDVFALGVGTLLVTLDQERLFDDSDFGQRVTATLVEASQMISAENRAIEATLTAEEAALTELRGTMPPEEFRPLADAFDLRVQALRRQQEERARALGLWRDIEQQRFFEAALPVLTRLLRDTGAVAIIDSRAILLALEEADLTAPAIARMNETLGDGAAGALPVFSPATLPPSLEGIGPAPLPGNGNGAEPPPPVVLPTPDVP